MEDGGDLDALNAQLVDRVNADGTVYLTQTIHGGRYIIRVSVGTTMTTHEDIAIAYDRIVDLATPLLAETG